MRIHTLIAAYRDDPQQIARLVDTCGGMGSVTVLADNYDRGADLMAACDRPFTALAFGSYRTERDKRNALLEQTRYHWSPHRDDWLLTIDPDENLLWGEMLTLILSRLHPDVWYHPIHRVEAISGITWEMPCRLFRARVDRYVYLDVGVSYRDESWNLDPRQAPGPPPRGWPQLIHYRSLRADSRVQGPFYTEPGPPDFDHDWKDHDEYIP